MKKIIFTLLAAVMLFSCDTVSKEEKEKNEIRSLLTTTFEVTSKEIQGMVIDDITVCDSCVFKNDRIYYYYTINEEYLPISQIEAESSTRKDMIKSTLEGNSEMVPLIDMLKKLGNGGFNYIYKGNATGATHTITIDY